MALRIRKDGRILCAAYHPAEEGDLYLDDHIHSYLGWCIPGFHPKKKEYDDEDYDWDTHEYFLKGRKSRGE